MFWRNTTFLIEHHMDLVMNISDYIYVIDFGSEIARGVPKEIQNNQAVIEDIVRYNIAAANLYLDVTIKCMDEKTCYYESGDFWGDTMSGLPKCGSSGKRMFDKFDKRFDRFEEQLLTLVQDDETDSIYYNGLLQMWREKECFEKTNHK